MRSETVEFVSVLKSAETPDDALAALVEVLRPYGYRYAKYGFITVHEPPKPFTECRFLSNLPDSWEKPYQEEFLAPHDYLIAHCARFRRPIPVSEVVARYMAGEFSGKQARACELAMQHRAFNGVAIPLRDAFPHSRGGLALVASSDMTPEEYEDERRRHMAAVYEIAEAFHGSLDRRWLIAENRQLSPREAECLSHAMQGLRTKQIAHQLGINEKTVEKQLASARRRLAARTNVQAAVKAMILGLIAA